MYRPHVFAFLFAVISTVTPVAAADCQKAIQVVFAHEGGYQNSRMDGGNWSSGKVGIGKLCGGTRFGIACAHNPGVNIKDLTIDQAAKIYEDKQCKEMRMSELNGQVLPTLLLDLSINMGSQASIILLKRTINLLNGDDSVSLDPVMSDEVVKWYNTYTSDKLKRSLFYSVLTLSAIDRYAAIVEGNKKQAVWLLGWVRRAIPNEIEDLRQSETIGRSMPAGENK